VSAIITWWLLPFPLLLLSIPGVAQFGQPKKPLSSDYLQWSASRRLQANDFQLKVRPRNNLNGSVGNFGLLMNGNNYDLLSKRANGVVQNVLYRAGSYLDSSNQLNTSIQLRYLQTLWDINEVAARQLRQELRNSAKRIILVGKPNTNDLFQSAYEAASKRQIQYADETNYGLFVDKQENWERQLADELKALAPYAIPD
jgi:hypothetical protein